MLNADRKFQFSKKRSQFPQNEVDQKKKIKKRQRISGWGPVPWGGSTEGEKFPHLGNPFTVRDGVKGVGSCRTSEGSSATGARKGKQREFITEIFKEKHFPAKKRFTLPTTRGALVLRFTLWGSDSRERSNVGCHENTLRELEHS